MPRETGSDTTSFESEHKKLAYANEFRAMLREHPGILRVAIETVDEAIAQYNPAPIKIGKAEIPVKYDHETGQWLEERKRFAKKHGKIDTSRYLKKSDWVPLSHGRGVLLVPGEPAVDENTGLTVTVLGRSNRDMPSGRYGSGSTTRIDKADYLKVDFQGQSFFVKKSFVTQNPGFVEFQNVIAAKELLKDLNFVKVVDAQSGYQDQKQSWYVSKWEDLEAAGFEPSGERMSIDDYGRSIKLGYDAQGSYLGFENQQAYEEAQQKAGAIKQRLEAGLIHRDLGSNLFYNRETRTFILLDVTGEDKDKTLGQPIRDRDDIY